MEEKKDLKQEEKKTTANGPTNKTTNKKATTSENTKKTVTRKTVKKTTVDTDKKVTSSTAKKNTIKEATKNPTVVEEKKIEMKTEPIKKEKTEKIEMPKKEEQTKTVEIKNKIPESKFEPVEKVEKKDKKHRVLKTILMVIIVALVLFLIHFVRNYIIVDNILAKQKDLNKATNYSLKIEYKNSNTTMEFYRKDNVMMLIKNSDTGKVVIWSDKDKKESIFLNMKDLTATVNKEAIIDSLYDIKPLGLIRNSETTRGFEFLYFITSEKVNGIDCYKITWIMEEETAWYNKENGRLVKTVTDGQKEDYVTEYSNWKFNELTDEDMSRPNLMGYEIKTNQKDDELS